MSTHFLALGGSYRQGSLTNAVLNLAAGIATGGGAMAECLTVSSSALGIFNPDSTHPGDPKVARLLNSVARAQSILLATPIYGGTPSGAVKNLLDTLHLAKSDTVGPLHGRRIVVVAVGGGTLNGMYHVQRGATTTLEIACKSLGGWVDPRHLEFSELLFDTDSNLRDVMALDALKLAVRRLVAVGDAVPQPVGGNT